MNIKELKAEARGMLAPCTDCDCDRDINQIVELVVRKVCEEIKSYVKTWEERQGEDIIPCEDVDETCDDILSQLEGDR